MSTLTLHGQPHNVALSHLALYGAAAMADQAGLCVRLGWSSGLQPNPTLTSDGDTAADVAHAVLACAESSEWTTERITLGTAQRGLMSPRISPRYDELPWAELQQRRHAVIDSTSGHTSTQRLFGGLGESSYWYTDGRGEARVYGAASSWEMQPRNRGSELVATKLDPLRAAVLLRSVDEVAKSLAGTGVHDDLAGERSDGRTSTGLGPLGPTDSVLAWCGLWGLAWLPVVHRTAPFQTSVSAASLRSRSHHSDSMVLPVFGASLSPARVRSVLVSDGLLSAATTNESVERSTSRAWLRTRGITGLVRFGVGEFGSGSAPERRIKTGTEVTIR
jgi:CRISPR-associated protein Csb3